MPMAPPVDACTSGGVRMWVDSGPSGATRDGPAADPRAWLNLPSSSSQHAHPVLVEGGG